MDRNEICEKVTWALWALICCFVAVGCVIGAWNLLKAVI
jgi:hypothetical protein